MIDRAHQVDELLMDDADDLLAGIERLKHLFAHAPASVTRSMKSWTTG